MGRRTRFIAFDWSAKSINAPNVQSPSATFRGQLELTSNEIQLTVTDSSLRGHTADASGALSASLGVPDGENLPKSCKEIVDAIDTLLRPTPSSPAANGSLQQGIEQLSLCHNGGQAIPTPSTIPPPLPAGTMSAAHLFATSVSGPSSLSSPSPQTAMMERPASLPAVANRSRPSHMDRLWPRKPIQAAPMPGKVYFVPDGKYFKDSIIHNQKNQTGFFRHPVLVVDVDGPIVNFYAMTKEPPSAIRELKMALRLGTNTDDLGPTVLSLAADSEIMLQETWINLEQRFFIEWKNLDDWAVNVQVDPEDLNKIHRRVIELEADQNRYIYKPLLRAMSTMQPGMIIMLTNAPGSATFGAPILVIENNYPEFHFLRVKRFEDNINFNVNARRNKGSSRQMSLAITKYPQIGHDGTPVMILEPESPAMREESYVEVHGRPQRGRLDQCKTWCWPPVRIDHMSMVILENYMADAVARVESYGQALPQENMPAYHITPPTYPHTAPAYGGYYQSPQAPRWVSHVAMQQPGYHMGPRMLTPTYPADNYMYGSHSVFQPRPGSLSGHPGM
jgi:hypothetical protein